MMMMVGLILEAKAEYTTHAKHRKKCLIERMAWLALVVFGWFWQVLAGYGWFWVQKLETNDQVGLLWFCLEGSKSIIVTMSFSE